MNPMMQAIADRLYPLSRTEVENDKALSEILHQSCQLIPYHNNGTVFYEELYDLSLEKEHLIIFGHDMGGYFFTDLQLMYIGYLHLEDDQYKQTFCNSRIEHFVHFHNSFINMVLKRIQFPNAANSGDMLEELEKTYYTLDRQAMENEEHFWPIRLYEVSEGFFPLDTARLEFYRSLYEQS
ncbi:SUKH-4 family immunity protein [Paenibacillus bovis]|uniref:DUF4375 domain-containing protein n=1 Tax=Paenibacillus bovis TaxID=1616788 RepID=A0A172ZHT3_9BACL|nr:SUKH-4 family immunity protein [Paenibacillus bovis]ANF96710.1 hypothetical protein AR543_12285 [Paenibacillus bovis]